MEITIKLSEDKWLRVLNAIALAPYREVQPLIEEIGKQYTIQKTEQVKGDQNG